MDPRKTASEEPIAVLHGLLGAALVATIGLIGSPWVLDWDPELVTVVNLVVAAWLAVGVFVIQMISRVKRQ